MVYSKVTGSPKVCKTVEDLLVRKKLSKSIFPTQELRPLERRQQKMNRKRRQLERKLEKKKMKDDLDAADVTTELQNAARCLLALAP